MTETGVCVYVGTRVCVTEADPRIHTSFCTVHVCGFVGFVGDDADRDCSIYLTAG